MSRVDYAHLPIVEDWTSTVDGKRRVYKLVPGKRIVLEKGDLWEPEDGTRFLDRNQVQRISLSAEEQGRQELAAFRWRHHLAALPGYRSKGREMSFWRNFASSCVLHDGPEFPPAVESKWPDDPEWNPGG